MMFSKLFFFQHKIKKALCTQSKGTMKFTGERAEAAKKECFKLKQINKSLNK